MTVITSFDNLVGLGVFILVSSFVQVETARVFIHQLFDGLFGGSKVSLNKLFSFVLLVVDLWLVVIFQASLKLNCYVISLLLLLPLKAVGYR